CAPHFPAWGRQDAPARVLELIARVEIGLLTDDAGPLDLLDTPFAVRDDPVPTAKLSWKFPLVRNLHGVRKDVPMRARGRLLRHVNCVDADLDAFGLGRGHCYQVPFARAAGNMVPSLCRMFLVLPA